MKSHLNHEVMADDVQLSVRRKTPIKLQDAPQIVICWPIGPKRHSQTYSCPENLGGCGKVFSTNPVMMPNLVPVHLLLSHMNLQQPLNSSMNYLVECGRLSAEARQIMTMQALEMGAKYILYWDDDTLPPADGLYVLHNFLEQNPNIGAVSGVYTTRSDPNEPLVYKEHGAGAAWDFEMGPGAVPEQILGAGAGFMLARAEAVRECLHIIEEEAGKPIPIWADERLEAEHPGEKKNNAWGHDMRFCRILNENGWPVYIDGRVLCGHVDAESGVIFTVPDTAPGFSKRHRRNVNTENYWDQVYSAEGADSWRKYPKMFQKVAGQVAPRSVVMELGCGVGILGSKLTAEKQVKWRGCDISSVAVAACSARFLNAAVKNVKDIVSIENVDVLIATELMEHLDEDVFDHVISVWVKSNSSKFIFTVPNNCMGPDEVPEHTALFNEALIIERLTGKIGQDARFKIVPADEHHLMVVMEK